jgi:superfamily II DNA/RNA helicase
MVSLFWRDFADFLSAPPFSYFSSFATRATTTLKPPYNPRNDFDLSFGEMDDGKQNHHDGVSARKLQHVPFRSVFQNRNLRTLVLDETDRLLELGFRRDIQDILACLNNDDNSPPSFGSSTKPEQQSRQTLLFSATVTQDIMDVVDLAITGESKNKNYQMVDCVHENDPTTHTNTGTTQSYIVLPPERFWTGSMEFILQLMTTTKKKKHKVIVFFEMTRLAELYSRFLSLRLGHTSGVWELHGKMHQRERTVVTRRFRNAPHGVLLTSDVSARGVDYPDVSHVVQVGAPQNRETYIHRLGRTGRAGREGEGVLILSPHEQGFVDDELVGLGVVTDDSLQKGLLSSQTKNTKQQSSGGRLGNIRKDLQNELGMLKHDLKTGRDHSGMAESLTLAYHSLVSYYFQTRRRPRRRRGKVAGDDPTPLPSEATTVAILNQLVEDFGLPELPPIGFKRAKSMGIEHLAGQLNIRKDWEDQNWDIHSSNGVESERNDHADFDDWFGLSSTPGAGGQNQSPPRQTSHNNNNNNNNNNNHNHNNNNHVHRPSVDSNHSTKEKPTKIEKKTKNIPQFDNL